LNFVGKFDAKLPSHAPDTHSGPPFHADSLSAHAPADAIIVPDAHLLFGADFKRSGVDLVLSDADHQLVLHDYFKGEKRAALASPDGAHLTGDIVNALTGQVDYAQAGGSAGAPKIIGHISKLAGSATCIRNGVSIILNNGDDVQKGDVVQSGSNSTVGITFIDGTVFGLSSNARMVLNEMVYDPNGSNNSSLLSLVAGTISFVAGETAKHGDMKVDTPVATMGIRGTAVLVEIGFNVPGQSVPDARFQVLVEPNGTTGSYILYDKTTQLPIATVNQAGQQVSLVNGVLTTGPAALSPEIQRLIQDVFTIKFTDNNPNTKSFEHYTDSINPQLFTPLKFADGTTANLVVLNVTFTSQSLSTDKSDPTHFIQRVDQAPLVTAIGGSSAEHFNLTRSSAIDTASGPITFFDINAGDRPTASATFESFTYENAQRENITASLTAQELAAVRAVAIPLTVNQTPGNTNVGSATWTYSLPDSAFDFLGAGETLTLTYLAQVNNNFTPAPQITSQPIVITIVGTNDVPVIASVAPQTIAYTGGTSVTGGNLQTHVPTSGTLTFDDPDLTDTHTVSVAFLTSGVSLPPAPRAMLEKALKASIAIDSTHTGIGTVHWALDDLPVYLGDFIPRGETLTLTYAVTVKDSHGATSTQNITVTITGTDAAAVVWIATTKPGEQPGGLWSDASNWETGTVPTANDDVIIITDQLRGLTPSYPVTIDAPAVAKSVTMNDFGTSPPKLVNHSTLAIGGAFSLSADSIVYNAGTIGVGGLMEVLDYSVLQNCGVLTLEQGGNFKGYSIISNAGTGSIEVAGGTLNVQVDIANSGLITVDSMAALTLDGAAIACGTVSNDGTIALTGGATLKNGVLGNAGHINVSGDGNALDRETLTNTGALEILALGALALGEGTAIANAHGVITIDGTGLLALNGATIDGGTINNYSSAPTPGNILAGEIDVTGSSTISHADLNYGHVTIESGQTLTLDGGAVTGAAFNGLATDATLHVEGHDPLTLNDVTVSGGAVTVEAGATVKTTGNVILTGTAVTNDGTIEIASGSVKLTGDIGSGAGHAGSVQIDADALFELDGSGTQNVVFHGAGAELQIDGASFGGKIVNLAATNEIDLQGIGYGPNTTGTYVCNADGLGVLTITDGTHSIEMTLVGNYTDGHFAGASDGNGGTLITLNAVDDAPVIATQDKAETGSVTELAGVTGSSLLDTASGAIHFTDIDLTDRPTASVTSQSATWTGGTLTSDQIHALEHAFSLAQLGNTNNGTIDWTYAIADGALDFLAEGQTATVTSTVELADGQGGSDIATVTITLHGAEDAPVVTGETDPSTQAIILHQSPDNSRAGVGTHSLGIPNETFHSLLAGMTSNHDRGHGDFVSDEFHNGPAGFVSDFHNHLGPIAGTAAVNDADIGDTLTASVTAPADVDYNGSTSLPPGANVSALTDPGTITFDSVRTNGQPDVLGWTYHPSGADLDFLEPGDTLTLAFKALVSDGHATTGSQTLSVKLAGEGCAVVNGTSDSETFANIGGGVTMFGKGGQDHFVFNKDFGSATIGDFDVHNDTIDIDHSLFSSVTEILQSAHSANSGHDTIITDAAHDQIILSGVTVADLMHASNFHLF
jgi:fibronectin-binding autotransporter adhesin